MASYYIVIELLLLWYQKNNIFAPQFRTEESAKIRLRVCENCAEQISNLTIK